MGNNHPITEKSHKRKWYKFLNQNDTKQLQDEFIINFRHTYGSINQITDINSLDIRRHVFVSLIGLFNTYKLCPCSVLYTAIFILPIKKDWLYNIHHYVANENTYPLDMYAKLTIFQSDIETQAFLKLLQWKDKQGLLFCMLDEYMDTNSNNKSNSLIHPFWTYLSNELIHICATYKPLNLNDQWWQHGHHKHKYMSRYNTKMTSIMSELYFLCMNYNSMKEIIYQSNPKLLNPITFYGENSGRYKICELNFADEICKNDQQTNAHKNSCTWFISDDYFD
eukprot:185371_1